MEASDGSRGGTRLPVIVNRSLQRFRRGFHRYALLLRAICLRQKRDSARHNSMQALATLTFAVIDQRRMLSPASHWLDISVISSVMRDAGR